jgi:ABC-2 type transport system permease protein
MILIDLLNPETKMDNLKSLLKDYGIIAKANFIVEEDKQQIYANNKMVIIPEYSNSEIVDMIRSRKLSIVLPYPGHLERSPEALKNITIESLLHSSEKSWIRYDWSDATERKSDNDLSGPADLAYSVKIDNTDLKMPAAKMIVIYNGEFTDNEMVNYQANFDFFMNALNWLEDRDNTLTIRPRVIDANRLILPGMLFIIFIILCTTIIPVLFFFLSMYIWMKRKNL